MTPLQVLLVAWARRRLILTCVVALGAMALVVSLLMPRTYKASADMLIDLRAPDPVQGTAPSPAAISGYVATQVDIIGSARVARRVVEALKLTEHPYFVAKAARAPAGADKATWIADLLLKDLEIRPSKEGNLVRLSYPSSDRQVAALVANGFASAYLDTVLQLKIEPARMNSLFFDERLQAARADVERAQRALSAFQRDHNLLPGDQRADIETARLAELSSQLVAVQATLVEQQARQAVMGRHADALPEVLGSAHVQALKGEIARLEGKLKESETVLGSAHPQYLAMKQELTTLREKQAAEVSRYGQSLAASGSASAQRERQLRAALDQQRQKVLQIRQLRDDMAVLQKDADAAQRAYDQIAQRQNQTTMESLNRQTNVAVLTPAVVPNDVSSPKVLLNAMFGCLGGLLVGLATALTLEGRQRRTRQIDDLTGTLQLPVLVVVPDARGRKRTSTLPHRPVVPRIGVAGREIAS